eukprot:Skav204366  [mRNA]  locus=scaffold866:95793:98040:+ [translate_table: standard]
MRARTGSGDREHHGGHGIKAAGAFPREPQGLRVRSVGSEAKTMDDSTGSSKEPHAQPARPPAAGQAGQPIRGRDLGTARCAQEAHAPDGRAEMAAAEAEAFSAGEPILHVETPAPGDGGEAGDGGWM